MGQTLGTINEILSNIRFELFGLRFRFRSMIKDDGFLIQLQSWMPCNKTGEYGWQNGGKYYISSHAVNSEICMTAWKACQDYVIHEARETFYYKDQTIFQPHFDVEELVEFCSTAQIVSRPKNRIVDHINDVKTTQDIDF